MNVEILKRGSVTVFKVSGKMYDEDKVQLLQEGLSPLLEEGERRFVFDLSRVPDSLTVGINAVVGCRNKVVKREGTLKLVLSDRLKGLYTMLFLDSLFEIHDSVEDALGSFAEN